MRQEIQRELLRVISRVKLGVCVYTFPVPNATDGCFPDHDGRHLDAFGCGRVVSVEDHSRNLVLE